MPARVAFKFSMVGGVCGLPACTFDGTSAADVVHAVAVATAAVARINKSLFVCVTPQALTVLMSA